MRRILAVLMVCASCGGAKGPARPAAGAGKDTSAGMQSCYVVKDDRGAVGFFAAFDPGSSPIPERLDSITFHAEDGTAVLTWNKGVELKPLDEATKRRARRGPVPSTKPRLRYATNIQAVDWGQDENRWPMTATVTIGADQPTCPLGELLGGGTSPSQLGAPNTSDELVYGNCPHCLTSFLCGCLELAEELEYCEPPLDSLDNCPEVLDYLFPPAS